ncbi:hypothetical protein BDZ91DRAFT_210333 [Kalaharituber pfeilii]|nr:hypothetical protein BDZ91DRAFT_210333 [Kalaharituber pfeilii]
MGIYYEWSASCSSRHCRPQEVLVPSRARTSATESSNSSRATSPSISNHVQLSKLECTKHLLIRQPAIAPILTPFAVSSGPNNVSGADIHLRIPSYFTDQSTFFMSHTLATLSSHESTLSFSKKRSTEAAFPQSSSADDTPPNSRPPSRAHMQKRPRFRNTTERPKYVTRKEESIPLQHSVGVSVNVLWPGSVEMETGTLGEVLEGYSGRMQNGTSGLNGMYGGGGAMRGRFIVLCFLGVTVEHLRQLSQVSSLLTSFNAHIFGVSLSAPPPIAPHYQ